MLPAPIAYRDPKPTKPRPIVKWVGGKAKLLPELLRRLPPLGPGARYFEPFAGGAALFFALAPERAVLGDANADLVACYQALARDPVMVLDLIGEHARQHSQEYFVGVRRHWNERRTETGGAICRAVRAAAFLYLNRACFNGLWRVNAAGEMNAPIGRRADGQLNEIRVDADNLRAAAVQFARAEFHAGDYRATIADARPGDLVYLDSPYDGTWTGYTAGGFGPEQQRELAETARALADRGVRVMLSNADTPLVRELYAWARIDSVRCPRAINSNGAGRGDVGEVIVCAGYAP